MKSPDAPESSRSGARPSRLRAGVLIGLSCVLAGIGAAAFVGAARSRASISETAGAGAIGTSTGVLDRDPSATTSPAAAAPPVAPIVTSDPSWGNDPTPRMMAPPAHPVPVVLAKTTTAAVLSRVPTTDRVIFLGIDDGLVRDRAVLAYLKAQGIPTTSFIVRDAAHQDPKFWNEAIAAGTTIEAHTLTHPDLTKLSSAARRKEICGSGDDFEALYGRRPTLFRPPYGAYNTDVGRIAASCGYRAVIMWAGSTNDGRLDLQDPAGRLHPGDIILMHWRTDLLDDLKTVVARCTEQGFTVARLEDYIAGA